MPITDLQNLRGDIEKWDQTGSPEIPDMGGRHQKSPRPPFGGSKDAELTATKAPRLTLEHAHDGLAELELAGDLHAALGEGDARQAVAQHHVEGVSVRDAAVAALAVHAVGLAWLAVLVTHLVTHRH